MIEDRLRLEITNHAIRRWQQRIEDVPETQAVAEMLLALQTAKPKHLRPSQLRKRTFYIPTARAMFVGCKGRIVTVLERGQSPFDQSDFEAGLESALVNATGQ